MASQLIGITETGWFNPARTRRQPTYDAARTARTGTRRNTSTANAAGRGEAIFSATRTAHSGRGA